MRTRILLTVAAATVLVLLAFLLPLAVLVGVVAENRATSDATLSAQTLVPLVGSLEAAELAASVDAQNATTRFRTTVFLPGSPPLGAPATRDSTVRLAQTGRSLTVDESGGRTIAVAIQGLPEGTAVIRVFVPEDVLTEGVARARWVLAGLGLVLLLLALLLGDALARSFLRPVRELAATADRLAGGDLDARVVPGGPAETRAVGTALNRLASRITELLTAEREAVADLSHRLRTPVTALRLDAEGLGDPEERQRLAHDVSELSRQVDEVIREARRPVREGLLAQSDATAVVADRVRFWSVLAEDTGRDFTSQWPATPLLVGLPREDLTTSVDALLGNVFAHTPEGIALHVDLQPRPGGGATLTVADAGPGFQSDHHLARGESGAGSTGLGLDIVRRCAAAAGGSVTLDRHPKLHGAAVVVELPGPRR